MKKIKYFQFVVLLGFVLSVNASQGYESDLSIFQQAIETLYPSYNRYDQQIAVEKEFDAARSILSRNANSDFSDTDFYRSILRISSALRDEHIIAFPNELYRKKLKDSQQFLPFTIRLANEQPYLVDVASKDLASYEGNRITHLDGIDAATVIARLNTYLHTDGSSKTFKIRRLQDFTPTQNENYFDLLYPLVFGGKEEYKLTLAITNDVSETITLSALSWPKYRKFYRERMVRFDPLTIEWFDNDIALLSVHSFHDWYYEEKSIDPAEFFKEVFAEIAKKETKTLILDLRHNEGGGSTSSLLLSYLMTKPFTEFASVASSFVGHPETSRYCSNAKDVALSPSWSTFDEKDQLYKLKGDFAHLIPGASKTNPQLNKFEGKLIVLISGITGSAATKVASVLDSHDRALFIGEETGGAAAGATAFGYCSLLLPHSQIKVDIPLLRFEINKADTSGRGVLPDIYVDVALTPPLATEDKTLKAAIKHAS